MKLSKVAIWSAVPLTIIGLIVSFLTAVAGAGHGDKSLIICIFPLPTFAWVLGGFVLGIVAACLQFPIYALSIYVAAKRRWEWQVAAGLFLIHAGLVFWIIRSA